MYIARQKRAENIAEYILYLWQLEDLLRAMQFSPQAIYTTLVEPIGEKDHNKNNILLTWYMEIGNLIKQEGKEVSGHLEHTHHLINDLQKLHEELLQSPKGVKHRELYSHLQPEMINLKEIVGKGDIPDVELAFRALYAVMLYRIKGDQTKENSTSDVIELISPFISELARVFHLTERGELDIWEREAP